MRIWRKQWEKRPNSKAIKDEMKTRSDFLTAAAGAGGVRQLA